VHTVRPGDHQLQVVQSHWGALIGLGGVLPAGLLDAIPVPARKAPRRHPGRAKLFRLAASPAGYPLP